MCFPRLPSGHYSEAQVKVYKSMPNPIIFFIVPKEEVGSVRVPGSVGKAQRVLSVEVRAKGYKSITKVTSCFS